MASRILRLKALVGVQEDAVTVVVIRTSHRLYRVEVWSNMDKLLAKRVTGKTGAVKLAGELFAKHTSAAIMRGLEVAV